jgi:outer membrane protein assembly factor BamB
MKSIRVFLFISLIAAGFLSCGDKEITVENSALKLLSTTPLQGQTDIYKHIAINDDVLYNNGIVVGSVDVDKRVLKMIDLNDKSVRWTWKEDIELAFSIGRMYQYNKYLVVQLRKNTYCIDLETGKSKFVINQPVSLDNWISGIGNTFFTGTFDESNGFESDLYKGDITTEEIKKYLTPDYQKEFPAKNPLGRVMYKATLTVYQGDTLLFLPYVEPNPPYDMFPKMGLYNMTKGKWLYQNKRVVDPATGYNTMPNGAKIIGDRIYLASGHDMICFELLTGKEIWRRNDFLHEFPFAFFGFEIYGNKLVTHTQGGRSYAIDVNTGQNIWKLENIGDPNSFMHHHNGVLYYKLDVQVICLKDFSLRKIT